MAYMTIQIDTGSTGPSVGDLNTALSGGSTKPDEVIQNIINLMYGMKGGNISADLSVSSSTVAGTVSGQTGGTSVFTISFK